LWAILVGISLVIVLSSCLNRWYTNSIIGDGIFKLRGGRTLFCVIYIEWALILVSSAELSTGEGGCTFRRMCVKGTAHIFHHWLFKSI